jgi:hypothetical protein
MSIVGGWVVNDLLFIAGDTRTTRPDSRGRFGTRHDFTQKIEELSGNIIIGLAGDFNASRLFKRLSEKLNKPNVAGYLPSTLNHFLIIKEIEKFIQNNWSSEWEETDFLIGIHDIRSKKNVLYKIMGADLKAYQMEANELHLVGLSASQRNEIKREFEKIIKKNNPNTMSDYGNCLIQALKSIEDETISKNINCLALAPDGSYAINSGIGYIEEDGNVNWVVDSLHDKEWTRKVNGTLIGKNTKDAGEVNLELGRKLK